MSIYHTAKVHVFALALRCHFQEIVIPGEQYPLKLAGAFEQSIIFGLGHPILQGREHIDIVHAETDSY